jgi:phage terminase large subunit-like protein
LTEQPADKLRAAVQSLSDEEANSLLYDWEFWARAAQRTPEGAWRVWLILAGRGWGKTRTGAEWVKARAESNVYSRIALIGPTAADVRDIMVEGESGLLAVSQPSFLPLYEPSKRRVTWPNGCIATCYSADEPERLRGPQHDSGWADELASWRYEEAWDMFQLGLRLGHNPQAVATTTPKPRRFVRELVSDGKTVLTGGSTYENLENLAEAFIDTVIRKYENTRLGRQELYAELLEEAPGALWKRAQIDELRVRSHPRLKKIIVALDPSVTNNEKSNECGIIGGGLGVDGHGYVLADKSVRASPAAWAQEAVDLLTAMNGDYIVAEVNNGGEMVALTIHTVNRAVKVVSVHASRGKKTRAEPVSALYEQKMIHHVGTFKQLEDQMCMYDPDTVDESPDRMDAMVWLFTELMVEPPPTGTYLGAVPLSVGSGSSKWGAR